VLLPIDVERAAVRDDTPALRYLWARGRIAELGDFNRLGRDDEAVREITRLGLAHNLLTDYTSFIAVDQWCATRRQRDAGRPAAAAAAGREQPRRRPGAEHAGAEFALLAALAGGLLWWQRRRLGARHG